MSNKKPTMKEMKNVVSNILIHMSELHNNLRSLDGAVSSYIEFNGNKDKWVKWVEKKQKQLEKEDNESKQTTGSGTKGDKKTK